MQRGVDLQEQGAAGADDGELEPAEKIGHLLRRDHQVGYYP